MAKQRKNGTSLGSSIWRFVEENPQLAAAIAFEVGALAAQAVSGTTAARLRKSGGRAVRSVANGLNGSSLMQAVPAALSFLPGPSAKPQPRKRDAKRAARAKAA
jgi:hypothetical protein